VFRRDRSSVVMSSPDLALPSGPPCSPPSHRCQVEAASLYHRDAPWYAEIGLRTSRLFDLERWGWAAMSPVWSPLPMLRDPHPLVVVGELPRAHGGRLASRYERCATCLAMGISNIPAPSGARVETVLGLEREDLPPSLAFLPLFTRMGLEIRRCSVMPRHFSKPTGRSEPGSRRRGGGCERG
jgi:hypothetical protein